MFWIIIVAVIALDQFTKYLIVHSLALGESMPVIKNFLDFTYTLNKGASFSIFQGQRVIFIIITIAVLIFVFWALKRVPKDMRLFRVFLALFCGGTIGNLIDRIYLGSVIDFVNLGWFPVFNVADSCISVSAIMICAMLLFGKPSRLLDKKKEKSV